MRLEQERRHERQKSHLGAIHVGLTRHRTLTWNQNHNIFDSMYCRTCFQNKMEGMHKDSPPEFKQVALMSGLGFLLKNFGASHCEFTLGVGHPNFLVENAKVKL